MAVAAEEMRDGNEDHSAQRGSRKRVPETSAKDFQLDKNPAADEGSDNSQNDVRNAAKAAAARDFSCEPTADEANEDPIEESVRKHGAEVPRGALIKMSDCNYHASVERWERF